MIGSTIDDFEQVRRRIALRDTYLRWLYRLHVVGIDSPAYSRFLDESSGPSCDEADIHRTTKWLKEMGFIRGTASAQTQGGVLRPCITTQGINRVEQGRSVNDQESGTVNIINANNSNVAIGSPNASQALTVTERAADDVQLAIDGLVALLGSCNSLTETQSGTLRDVVEELQDEVSRDDAKPQRIRKWLAKAEMVLTSVGAVADVAAVAGLVQAAIGSLT